MAYSPKTWALADPITDTDLNRIEAGIAAATETMTAGVGQVTGLTTDTRVTSGPISFGQTFTSAPYVVATVIDEMPDNCTLSIDPASITTDHFHVIAHRIGGTTTMDFNWIALGA